MNDIALTYREFFLYAVIIGAFLGALLGLVPLILGRRKNKARLGLYGFLASIFAGLLHPLLALIVAGIFAFLIIREKTSPTATGSEAANDSASESATTDRP